MNAKSRSWSWKDSTTGYFSFVVATWLSLHLPLIVFVVIAIDAISNRWIEILVLSFLLALPFSAVRYLAKSPRPLTCYLPLLGLLVFYFVMDIILFVYFKINFSDTYAVIVLLFAFVFEVVHLGAMAIVSSLFYLIDHKNKQARYTN
jgi:hypothetical protein